MRDAPAAAMRREGTGDFEVFSAPGSRLRGGWREWDLLDAALAGRRGTDGAAAGYFSYEGDFDFTFFASRQSVPAREWLGEGQRVTVGDGAWSGWRAAVDLPNYTLMVAAAQEHIRRGNIYQVNLARAFTRQAKEFDAWRFFKILWSLTAAPLAAYYATDERVLLSASPELFLTISGRRIVTKPVKGTRPRGADAAGDARNAAELSASPKERAELVMITDLARNDLGRVCEFGSVRVSELLAREQLSHVFHLVSTVEGRLRAEVSPVQAVRACFPGGSITGAPKQRAMEIIAELEPFRRGFFTGAMGWFDYHGNAQFNIAIRTAEWRADTLTVMAGSGITIGSAAREEFWETEHKARALREAWSIYERG
jgi:anthranilate/para-aminobenzoate synthase component I